MTMVGRKGFAVLVLLLLPALLFAAGQFEDGSKPVSEADVLKLIRASGGDMINMLGDACGACHGGETEYGVAGAVLSYKYSGHNLGWEKHGENSWYANGASCAACHTSEGFVEYVNTGTVENDIAYPSQPGCFSCHDPHVTGDFSVRTTAPVQLAAGVTFDVGGGNLCAICHQGRREVNSQIKAGQLRPYFGPHHGPEADMFLGVNGFEMPGKSYGSSAHTYVVQDSCVECHLALPEGRYSLSPQVGGHSFYTKGEVHGATKINASACDACHEDVGQDGEYFDVAAKADYDGDGTIENAQAEVEGLLNLVVNENGTGVLQKTNPPAYRSNGSWNSTRGLEFPVDIVAAVWNYKFVLEDRSVGIHNTKYAVQLLMDTIGYFDSSFDMSTRP